MELPSIIVDVRAELTALVERVLGRDGDEHAEAELLRQGQAAMPAIMDRFPGPITVDADRLALVTKGPISKDLAVRVSECGPLLRLIAGQRRVALPFVLKKIGDDDADHRFWATFLLTELVYAESAERKADQARITHDVTTLHDTVKKTSVSNDARIQRLRETLVEIELYHGANIAHPVARSH